MAKGPGPKTGALPFRVSNGTRTRDILDHNQVLYHLSYTHRVRSFLTGREKVYRVREGARAPVVQPLIPDLETPVTSGFPRSYDDGVVRRVAMALACSESGPGCGTKIASR